MDELDTFLDTGTQPLEETPEPIVEAPEGQPRDEAGRFASKTGVEEQAEPDAVPPTDKLPAETFKGLKEEREKRQNLERELEALKQQLNQQTQAPPAPPPSIWEDDQAALHHTRVQAVSEASFNARLDMSEMLASQAHEDFDGMKAKFLEMAAVNPALAQQALAARHPWEHAYQTAKNAARFEEMGATNVSELEAKIREQLEAEYKAKHAPAQSLPNSLADAQSARVDGTQQAMLSLSDILKR